MLKGFWENNISLLLSTIQSIFSSFWRLLIIYNEHLSQPQPCRWLSPFLNTLHTSENTLCGSKRCHTESYLCSSYIFMALRERAHPYNTGQTFSKNIKDQWRGNTSKWLTSGLKTLPTTFHTITDTRECLQRKPYPFIVGVCKLCKRKYVNIAVKVWYCASWQHWPQLVTV